MVDRPIDEVDTNVPIEPEAVEPTQEVTKVKVDNLSVLTDQSDEDITKALNEGETYNSVKVPANPSIAIDEAVENGWDQNQVLQRVQDIAKTNGDLNTSTDVNLNQILLTEGAFGSSTTNYYANVEVAGNMFKEAIDQSSEDKGTAGLVTDFVDRFFIRQIPIGALEDIFYKNSGKSEELLNAAVTMGREEYKEFISGYIDELRDEGVFKSDNLFALQQGFNNAVSSGYNPDANADAVLGAVDIVGVISGPIKGLTKLNKLKALKKADSAVQKVAVVKGSDKAGDVAGKVAVKNPTNPVKGDDAMPSMVSTTSPPVKPNTSRSRKAIEESATVTEIKRVYESGALGKVITPDELAVVSAKVTSRIAKQVDRPIRDTTVVEDLGNFTLQLDIGKSKTGDVFKAKSSADKLAKKIEGSEVVELTDGWIVRKQERLDTSGVSDEISLDPVFSGVKGVGAVYEAIHRVVGSSANRIPDALDSLAIMGESGTNSLIRAGEKAIDSLNALNARDQTIVGRILEDLRDGADSATRNFYSDAELASKYEAKSGKAITEKVTKAYKAAVELNDAAYYLKANSILSRYTNFGYKKVVVDDAFSTPAKKLERMNVPTDAKVYDAEAGKVVPISSLPTDIAIWVGDKNIFEDIKYLANPKGVSILNPEDVLGYNSGGRRVNQNAAYFVTLGDDASGAVSVSKRERALFSARTNAEAKKGAQELENIAKAKREGNLTDSLVAQNNSWNLNLETVDELEEFLKAGKIDLNRTISSRARGDRVTSIDADNPFYNDTYVNYVSNEMSRSDDVLLEYGGTTNVNDNPLSAIVQQYSSEANNLAMKAFSHRSIGSWIEASKKLGGGVKLGDSPNPLIQMSEATITSTSIEANRLSEIRGILMRRLNIQSELSRRFNGYINGVTENLPFVKSQVDVGKAERGLLNVGFMSNFGFMNTSQFIMQAFHSVTIAAMHPVHGSKAAVDVLPLRMLLNTTSSEAYELGLKRFADRTGFSVEETREIAEYFYTSGRDIVSGDAAELGTGIGKGLTGVAGDSMAANALGGTKKAIAKAMDVGLIPFNQGERMARSTSVMTAIRMYKAANPSASILTQEARKWIAKKDAALTLNMTTQGRALAQEGLMKVPTQWLSFSFRAMEGMVFGKDLTKGERARLFMAMVPMFGMSGFGVVNAADYFAEKLGVSADSDVHSLLRYGMMDYMITALTPFETALGERLAPLGILGDITDKLASESLVEAALGPSGNIAGGIVEAATSAIGSLYNDDYVNFRQDVETLIRQPAGIDNAWKAIGILRTGTIRNKNGAVSESNFDYFDAVVQGLGFSPAEVIELRERSSEQYLDSQAFTTMRREIDKDAEVAFGLIASASTQDQERGLKMFDSLRARINILPFSVEQKSKIRAALNKNAPKYLTMIKNYNEQGKLEQAERVRQLIGGE